MDIILLCGFQRIPWYTTL